MKQKNFICFVIVTIILLTASCSVDQKRNFENDLQDFNWDSVYSYLNRDSTLLTNPLYRLIYENSCVFTNRNLEASIYSNLINNIDDKKAIDFSVDSILLVKKNEPIYYFLKGSILNRLNKSKEAISYFNKSLELNDTLPYSHIGLGLAFLNDSKFDNALNEFNKAIELDTNIAFIYNKKGLIFLTNDDYLNTELMYNIAVSKDNTFTDAYFNLYDLYSEFDRNFEALLTIQNILSRVDKINKKLLKEIDTLRYLPFKFPRINFKNVEGDNSLIEYRQKVVINGFQKSAKDARGYYGFVDDLSKISEYTIQKGTVTSTYGQIVKKAEMTKISPIYKTSEKTEIIGWAGCLTEGEFLIKEKYFSTSSINTSIGYVETSFDAEVFEDDIILISIHPNKE